MSRLPSDPEGMVTGLRSGRRVGLALWLVLLSVLVVYGSVFPFEFQRPRAGAWQSFWTDWRLGNSRGDLLGNVALFVPWGLAWAWGRGRSTAGAFAAAIVSGVVLATLAQLLQLAVPVRTAQLSDVVWNTAGIVAGWLLGVSVAPPTAADHSHRRSTGVLLAACLAVCWLPLVPSIDASLLKAHLHQLASFSWRQLPAGSVTFVAAAFGSELLSQLLRRHVVWATAAWCALLVLPRLLIVGADVNGAVGIGAMAGWFAWLAIRAATPHRATWLVCVFLAVQALASLAPFELRQAPVTVGLVPFESLLKGSMLTNAQSLGGGLLVAVAIVHSFASQGASVRGAAVATAVSLAVLELPQTMIESRTPDLTVPAIVAALGLLWGHRAVVGQRSSAAPGHMAHRQPEPRGALPPAPAGAAPPSTLAWWVAPATAALAVAAMAMLLGWALRRPGLPYNVRELFLMEGAWPSLALFATAVLWAGAGPVLGARHVARSAHPGWSAILWAFVCSVVMLGLLSLSVTEESIGDVAGSSNRYWFVTQKGDWGPAMAEAFRILGPAVVDPVERIIRFVALYGPLPMLCIVMAAWGPGTSGAAPGRQLARSAALATACAAWLLACKFIAFDHSSTDNLNELIARDGEWGMGGGGYLYALLLLSVACAWLLARAVAGPNRAVHAVVGLALAVAMAPVGWWLIDNGLEHEVRKYELTYSGTQFLLGPDRRNALPEAQLAARWMWLQSAAIATLAMGMAIALLRRNPRSL